MRIFEKDKKRLRHKILILEEALTHEEDSASTLQQEMEAANARVASLEKMNGELQQSLRESQNEFSASMLQEGRLRREMNDQTQIISDLRRELSLLGTENTGLQAQLATRTGSTTADKGETRSGVEGSLRRELEAQQRQVQLLENRLRALTEDKSISTETIATLRSRLHSDSVAAKNAERVLKQEV